MPLPLAQTSLTRSGSGVLYSTIQFTSAENVASAVKQFFTYGKGSQKPGSTSVTTITDTNLRQAGTVGGQASFVASGIALQLYYTALKVSLSAADLHNLLDGSIISWAFQDFTTEIAPACMIPAGGGFQGVAGTAGAVASELTAGLGLYRFAPVVIYPNATFAVQWDFPTTATTNSANVLNARIVLVGEYQNAVAPG